MAGVDQHCIPVDAVPELRRISFQVSTAIGSFALASAVASQFVSPGAQPNPENLHSPAQHNMT